MDIFSGEGIEEANQNRESAMQEVKHNLPWIAKYAPKTIEDVILPDRIKDMVTFGLDNNEFTHVIFHSGKPGSGKTSLAKAIPEDLGTDYLFFPIAKRSMEVLDTIQEFAKQKLTDGKPRFVILDEADRPAQQIAATFYSALQPLIESSTSTLRFILTCNNIHKIPEPIRSRCSAISFAYSDDASIKKQLFSRMQDIAKQEVSRYNGTVETDTLKEIARIYYPDIRAILQAMYVNFLSNKGSIIGQPVYVSYNDIENMWDFITKYDDVGLRKYVTANIVDFESVYAPFGQYVMENIPKQHRLNFAILLGKYQHQAAIPAVDQEININSFFASLMLLLQSGKK